MKLNAASLGRAATVVRDRGDVADGEHLDAHGLDGADGGFTAGARALDLDDSFFQAMAHGDSHEAALHHLRDAMELWIETAKEHGDEVPTPKGGRLIFA